MTNKRRKTGKKKKRRSNMKGGFKTPKLGNLRLGILAAIPPMRNVLKLLKYTKASKKKQKGGFWGLYTRKLRQKLRKK